MKRYSVKEANNLEEISVRGLRQLIFELDQNLTIKELRNLLFQVNNQDMLLSKHNIDRVIF